MDYVWLIVIMAAAAILPDVLRRKRKYPKRNGPIPIPPRKEEVKRKRQSLQQPVKATETVQDKKENPTAPTAGKKNAAEPALASNVQILETVQSKPAITASTVPHMVQPEPWSMMEPEARDIYAGLVWAEILDKPLALRSKNR